MIQNRSVVIHFSAWYSIESLYTAQPVVTNFSTSIIFQFVSKFSQDYCVWFEFNYFPLHKLRLHANTIQLS